MHTAVLMIAPGPVDALAERVVKEGVSILVVAALIKIPSDLPSASELIERRIFLIRGHKIMLDSDLAELYQVPTKAFNQAVKRNLDRFPSDFMFRLSSEEMELLNRSQIVTGSQKHRDPRYLP